MVTFIVDADPIKQIFLVHKSLACAQSPFFKAAFESQMTEDITQSMRLEDVEAETFGLLVNWVSSSCRVKKDIFLRGVDLKTHRFLVVAKTTC